MPKVCVNKCLFGADLKESKITGTFVSALDFVLSEILFVYLPAEGQMEVRHCCRLAGELNGVEHLAKYFPLDKTDQNLKPRQEHFELVPPRMDQQNVAPRFVFYENCQLS